MKPGELDIGEVAGKISGRMCANSKQVAREVLAELGLDAKYIEKMAEGIYGQIVDGGGDDQLYDCILVGLGGSP